MIDSSEIPTWVQLTEAYSITSHDLIYEQSAETRTYTTDSLLKGANSAHYHLKPLSTGELSNDDLY